MTAHAIKWSHTKRGNIDQGHYYSVAPDTKDVHSKQSQSVSWRKSAKMREKKETRIRCLAVLGIELLIQSVHLLMCWSRGLAYPRLVQSRATMNRHTTRPYHRWYRCELMIT
jgi:hypothetical protein